ncbi:MAG: DUF167 domain-containing protein [Candidatus Sungbacteria bacterium]|nr:DUF167 domain-containing protein [bacterium]MDZ4260364.1 DUF167 domain-containing protein [Candidatus Sungbacteria bacterium]
MKIFIRVKPNGKVDEIESVNGSHYAVRLKASPMQGKANEALIALLAKHLDIARSRIHMISGFSSRQKVVEIS